MPSPRRTLAVTVAWLTLIDVAAAAVAKGTTRDHYGIIADAGSSSTKVKVFKWQKSDDAEELPALQLLDSQRLKPGMGDYVTDPQGLHDHLASVISAAARTVPESLHSSTPIFVMSTAGTRVLHPYTARDFSQTIEGYLSNSSLNPFVFRPSHAQILSGEEEGVYAWIALNYLRGYFRKNRSVPESAGVLEMGGGSTQVAFVPEVPIYSDEFHVTLMGHRHDLYVHSHLQFGLTYLRTRYWNLLALNSSRSTGDIPDPCQLRGDSREVEAGGAVRRLVGSGDAVQCRAWLSQLVYRGGDDECLTQPCGLGSVYQPPVGNRTFYAIQAFLHAPTRVRALRPDRTLDLQLLADNAAVYCRKTLDEAESEYGSSKEYASNDCFGALYISLLLQAYGFTKDSRIFFFDKIDNVSIDWALGAILYELSSRNTLSYCPAASTSAATHPSPQSSAGLGFLLLLLVAMATGLDKFL